MRLAACRHHGSRVFMSIDKLVAERDALRRAWENNHRDRIRIQHRLDSLTHQLSRLTGLPVMIGDAPTLDVPSLLAGGLGLGRRRSRRKVL
jgi:hypothetical protein